MQSLFFPASSHECPLNGLLSNYLTPSVGVRKNKQEELEMFLEQYKVMVHSLEL